MHTPDILFQVVQPTEKEKKSSFYVCRWEIIGFVKRTTQTVEKEEVVENDESMKIRKMTEIVCLIFSTKENINDSWLIRKYQGLLLSWRKKKKSN